MLFLGLEKRFAAIVTASPGSLRLGCLGLVCLHDRHGDCVSRVLLDWMLLWFLVRYGFVSGCCARQSHALHPFPWDMLVRTKIYVWSPRDWTLLQRDRGWLSLARSLSPPSMNAYCARLPTKSSAQGAHVTGCQVGCRADLYCTSTGTSSLRGPGRKSRMEWLGSVSASWEMSCGFLCAVGLRCMTLSAWGALHDD